MAAIAAPSAAAGGAAASLPTRHFNFAAVEAATNLWETRIGAGATGEVFRGAMVLAPGEEPVPVAVKRLRVPPGGQGGSLRRAFIAEASALGALHHLNVVRLLGYADDGGGSGASAGPATLVLVFELLAGSLADRLQKAPLLAALLPPAARLENAVGVARGVAYLHGQHVPGDTALAGPFLHRDIKAANIGLDANGVPKLLDCGLSRAMKGEGGGGGIAATVSAPLQSLTGGVLIGTVGYMAPEIARGRYGVASELFSFGVVLLELLMGEEVDADTLQTVRDAVDDDADHSMAPLLARADQAVDWPADVAETLSALVLECTAPRPEHRPPTMRAVFQRLVELRAAFAPPMRECVVCHDAFAVGQGLCCGERQEGLPLRGVGAREGVVPMAQPSRVVAAPVVGGGGGGGGRVQQAGPGGGATHFTCRDCLQGYVRAECDPVKLRALRGAVACPGMMDAAGAGRAVEGRPGGAVAAAGLRRCVAPPWQYAISIFLLYINNKNKFLVGVI